MSLARTVLLPALIALLAPAGARAGWTDPATVATGGAALADLAADSGGGLLATWNAGASGAWAQARDGTAFGPVDVFPATAPVRAATDGRGAVHLAWADGYGVHYARRAPDGSLDRRATPAPANVRAHPVVAADPAGDVAVAWREFTDGAWFVRVAVRPAGREFGTAARLGSGTAAQDPVVAVTPRGEVVVAWFQNGSPRTVLAAAGALDGGFEAPVPLAAEGSVVGMQALAHPGGAVTLVWSAFGSDRSMLRAAQRPANGAFGEPGTIATGGVGDADDLARFSAAPLPAGWLVAYRRGQSVYARTVAGTAAGPARTLEEYPFDQRYRLAPAVAVDPAGGRGVIAWSDRDERVAVKRVLADGSLTATAVISPASPAARTVRAAMAGEPAVAWDTEGADGVLRFSRFTAPPDGSGGGGGGGGTTPPPPPPGDRTAPRVTLRLARVVRTRRTVRLRVTCSERCRLTLTGRLTQGRRPVGTLRRTRWLAARRSTPIVLTLGTAARRELRAGRRIRLVLTARARDRAGNTRSAVRSASLRRPG